MSANLAEKNGILYEMADFFTPRQQKSGQQMKNYLLKGWQSSVFL